jgi:Glycosyl transferases group 1
VLSTPDIEALRLVDEALALAGRRPDQLELVVLHGSRAGTLVEALAARAPALPQLLVLEPDPHVAHLVQKLAAGDGGFGKRLTLLGPEQLQPAQDLVGAYLTIGQFLLGSRLAPSKITYVVDPAAAEGPQGRALSAALADLTRGLSRDFLRLVAPRREFSSVLGGLAKFLAAQGEHYHALKFYSSIAPDQMTAELVQAAFTCLLALGNPDFTEHWLTQSPLDEPSRQFLRGQVPAPDPTRKLEATARLERNLSWLEPHFPTAVAALRQAPPATNLFRIELPDQPWRLRTTPNGRIAERRSYSLLVRAQGLALTEENPLDDLAELEGALTACAQRGQDHVWFGRWVKYAMMVEQVISEPSLLTLHGWRRVTFLQEEDAPALTSLLSAIELAPWFDAAHVRLTVGATATSELIQSLEENLNQAVPELGIGVTAEAKKQVMQRRFRRLAGAPELFSALERRYQQHPERLRRVMDERSRPLKVVLMTSRYTTVLQHVTRDLAEGFEELGHRTWVLNEHRAGETLIAFDAAQRLLEIEPDFVFVLDHIRPEYASLLPSGLPVVSWVLDELPSLKDPSAIALLGSLDLTYGFNGAVARGFRALGYPNMGQLPFAVNPARYFAEPPSATASGIAFTTHIGQFTKDPDGAPGLNAALTARFNALPEILIEMGRISPMLESALQELGLVAPPEATRQLLYHALMLARQQDRERVAQQIVGAGLPLTVYGLGWDSLPEFAGKVGGVVPAGPALRQVYRQHRAVLHINRGCNIHPRVLESMCSGGLVIARWDPLDDEPGETCDQLGDALPLFHDKAEMLALLQRAVTDDAFRNELVLRGQARVLEQHTYRARASKVLGDLKAMVEAHLRLPATADATPQPLRSAHA